LSDAMNVMVLQYKKILEYVKNDQNYDENENNNATPTSL